MARGNMSVARLGLLAGMAMLGVGAALLTCSVAMRLGRRQVLDELLRHDKLDPETYDAMVGSSPSLTMEVEPVSEPEYTARWLTCADGIISALRPDPAGLAVCIHGEAVMTMLSGGGAEEYPDPDPDTWVLLPKTFEAQFGELVRDWHEGSVHLRLEIHWVLENGGWGAPRNLSFIGSDGNEVSVVTRDELAG